MRKRIALTFSDASVAGADAARGSDALDASNRAQTPIYRRARRRLAAVMLGAGLLLLAPMAEGSDKNKSARKDFKEAAPFVHEAVFGRRFAGVALDTDALEQIRCPSKPALTATATTTDCAGARFKLMYDGRIEEHDPDGDGSTICLGDDWPDAGFITVHRPADKACFGHASGRLKGRPLALPADVRTVKDKKRLFAAIEAYGPPTFEGAAAGARNKAIEQALATAAGNVLAVWLSLRVIETPADTAAKDAYRSLFAEILADYEGAVQLGSEARYDRARNPARLRQLAALKGGFLAAAAAQIDADSALFTSGKNRPQVVTKAVLDAAKKAIADRLPPLPWLAKGATVRGKLEGLERLSSADRKALTAQQTSARRAIDEFLRHRGKFPVNLWRAVMPTADAPRVITFQPGDGDSTDPNVVRADRPVVIFIRNVTDEIVVNVTDKAIPKPEFDAMVAKFLKKVVPNELRVALKAAGAPESPSSDLCKLVRPDATETVPAYLLAVCYRQARLTDKYEEAAAVLLSAEPPGGAKSKYTHKTEIKRDLTADRFYSFSACKSSVEKKECTEDTPPDDVVARRRVKVRKNSYVTLVTELSFALMTGDDPTLGNYAFKKVGTPDPDQLFELRPEQAGRLGGSISELIAVYPWARDYGETRGLGFALGTRFVNNDKLELFRQVDLRLLIEMYRGLSLSVGVGIRRVEIPVNYEVGDVVAVPVAMSGSAAPPDIATRDQVRAVVHIGLGFDTSILSDITSVLLGDDKEES